MYDTGEYAGTRIAGTVILLKRQPVLVRRVTEDKVVVGATLGRGSRKVVQDLSEFNLTDYRLGYFNSGGVAYYMSRKAMRQDWKQGVRLNNVDCSPYKDDLDVDDIAKCLRQRHFPLSKAIADLGDGASSVAWCKDFCITNKQIIMWKSYAVGHIDDGVITLDSKFKFLTKILGESTHECYEIV